MAVTTDTLAVAGVATNMVRMVTLCVNALVLVLDRGLNSSYACILYIVMFFSIHLYLRRLLYFLLFINVV